MPIILNRARCLECGEEVASRYRHDFVTCECGAMSVDGGRDYLKRCAKDLNKIEETTVYAITTRELEEIIEARIAHNRVSACFRRAADDVVRRYRQTLQALWVL